MTHPILAAATSVGEVLKDVATVNPTFMTTSEKAEALRALVAVESRLVELRLRVMAAADDVAADTGARDLASWMAAQTRASFDDLRRDAWLAEATEHRYGLLAAGLRDGDVNPAQAVVVARALDALPQDVDAETRGLAERTLVAHCADFGPRPLARLGRRILEVVAPEIAEAAEARRLLALEAEAARKSRLTLRRVGDGTTRINGLLPDLAATRLALYLEAFTNPRKTTPTGQEPETPEPVAGNPLTQLPYPRTLGQAFCEFLDTIDPKPLPLHAGDATTLVITMTLDALRTDLATADLLTSGHIPGTTETADTISAHHARRLACTAGIIPVVLGGPSEPLDLGRTRRLFTPAQRKALLISDHTCRAHGCSVPGTWTEAHHPNPWNNGGPTNLTNAMLLCRHHHQRAHDPTYTTHQQPDGQITFTRQC